MTKRDVHNGKPYAGNPHMRFDDGEDASATSRCGSLFCKRLLPRVFCMVVQILGLCASVFGSVRPYEFEWADRTRDDRPVLLPLESAKGWTCRWSQATGRVETAREHLLFGDGVMRITHKALGGAPVLKILPSKPVKVAAGFDTLSIWIYGNMPYRQNPADPTPGVLVTADFLDADGRPFSVDIYRLAHQEWFLAQKRLSAAEIARARRGGVFTGFTITGGTNKSFKTIELTSFAAYREALKPLSFKPRPQRGVRVFSAQSPGLNTGKGRLPFPNRTETIVPPPTGGRDLSFRWPEKAGNWDDLAYRVGSGPWRTLARGGGLWFLRGQTPVRAAFEDIVRTVTPTGAVYTGTVRAADASARVHLAFRVAGQSLVLDLQADGLQVSEVRFGVPDGSAEGNTRHVRIPYYGRHAVVTEEGGRAFFLLASVDWTQSNASEVFTDGVHPGGTRYLCKTDGRRNPVFERFVWSLSPVFAEVLPVVPNPPSPYRGLTAGYQWCHAFASNREKDKAFWRSRRRRGLTKVFAGDHEGCMRDGNESFTFRTRPAPGKGGDAGQADFTRFMIDTLGYLYGPYNNYADFAPVNGYWHADRMTRRPDGNLQPTWTRCYSPKPAWVCEASEEIATELQRKFRFNSGYCDVMTALKPWTRTDYDARVPGAGTFAATFYAYGELMLLQKKAWGGPVYSEGGCHYMYCGLVDGNFAQDRPAQLHIRPWLVDFDLLRLHPLANNFGMGYPSMFWTRKYKVTDPILRADRFLAATVAFGHQGYFWTPSSHDGDTRDEEHGYFMLLGTGAHYCKADVKTIRYQDGDGSLLDTSAALASGAWERSQIVTVYTDGTRTVVNGSTNEPMPLCFGSRRLTLPPNGFLALSGDGSAAVVSGAAWRGGGRLDMSVSPDYVYFDAYGALSTTPWGGTDGRMYRLNGKDGTEEVFLRTGTVCELPYAAVSVTALDFAGEAIGSAPFTVVEGRTRLSPMPGAFSYRVRKPSGWREAPAKTVFAGYLDGPPPAKIEISSYTSNR